MADEATHGTDGIELPLSGVRILDLTRFLSGPYATMVLAELGADVIKIEQPHTGDDAREMAPKVNEESYPFGMPNRSKRSVSLDLKDPRGVDLFLRLAEGAQVVVENFRPGVADRLGIGYEAVQAVREDVVYCSISGFGQTGPYRNRPGFDIMAQGMTGFMRMTGEPGGRPAKVGIAINDIAAGATAIYSIMGAEMVRRRTGRGQYLDISLVDAGLAWTVWESGAYFASGEVPVPAGTRHRRSAPYQAFRTADGYVTIGAANQRLWVRLTAVLQRPEWVEDPRFGTNEQRIAHLPDLERLIEEITVSRTTEQWLAALDEAGIPCGQVLSYDESVNDPHVLARDMVVEMEHPLIGPMRTIAPPTKFSGMPFAVRSPAPWLGQHTAEVFRSIGVDDDVMADLFDAGVLFDHHPELHEPTSD
ncbi:CoA transferase [Nocardioides aquiterrae]|uniref:CoA transferase n=1 Tax=Nocardioides aquiterrae TaxID=203799 RepID=A0ABN1UD10_9ACTN